MAGGAVTYLNLVADFRIESSYALNCGDWQTAPAGDFLVAPLREHVGKGAALERDSACAATSPSEQVGAVVR